MKILQRTAERLVFGLGVREKALLDRLLGFYPMHPDARPPLSRQSSAPSIAEAEALLHEALRDQKKELAQWLNLRLTDGEAFTRTGSGWRLSLAPGEMESLLQVLNELRVGAWTRLGCPDNLDDAELIDAASRAPFHAIMTVAGQFEMVLLAALETGSDRPPKPTGEAPSPSPEGS